MQIYKKELKIYERTLEKFYILEKSCKFTEKKNHKFMGKSSIQWHWLIYCENVQFNSGNKLVYSLI